MNKNYFTKIGFLFFSLLMSFILFAGCSSTEETQGNDEAVEWEPNDTKVMISNAVGGGQDSLTRALGEVWGEKLGFDFTYENVEGASGRVGYDAFLEEDNKIEGELVLSSNLSSASIMYAEQEPDWNWDDSIEPLGIMSIDPGLLFVNSSSSFNNFEEIVDEAQDDTLTVAISYWASPENLFLHQVMNQTGAQFEIIPFESAVDVITQVIGGHVDFGFTKAASLDNTGDEVKYVGITMHENPIQEMTDNIEPVDDQLGTNTLAVASYRGINVSKEFADNYPERFQILQNAFEEAKDDPELISEAEDLGVAPDLMVDWESAQIADVIQDHFDAFEEYGYLFD